MIKRKLSRIVAVLFFAAVWATTRAADAPSQGECDFIASAIEAASAGFLSLKGPKDEDSSWKSKVVAPGATYCEVQQKKWAAEFVCYWEYGNLAETELRMRAKDFMNEIRVCVEKSVFVKQAWAETASGDNGNNPSVYVVDENHDLVIEIRTNADYPVPPADTSSDVYLSVEWFMPARDWPNELAYMKKVNLPMIPLGTKKTRR
jgi:hypothetical protein